MASDEVAREFIATEGSKKLNPAREILSVLRRHFESQNRGGFQQWVFFEEVRLGTGFQSPKERFARVIREERARSGLVNPGLYEDIGDPEEPNWEARIDAVAFNMWRRKSYRRIAFEVKVSRSDFAKEVKNPHKREAALTVANQLYFVCPAGLIRTDEIPEGCGLIYIDGRKVSYRIRAPYRESAPPEWRFVAALARRIAREGAAV